MFVIVLYICQIFEIVRQKNTSRVVDNDLDLKVFFISI